jgi:group I intron endonuclease
MIVYKITNNDNKKVYIGVTSKTFDERMKGHRNNKLKTKFNNALKKYGWENFTKEVIEEVDTLDELFERETFWIDFYNSYSDGYNSTLGGEVSPMLFDQNKSKLSNTIKKRLQTKEQKMQQVERLLNHCKTHDHPRLNVKLSDETKRKISEGHTGKKLSPQHIDSISLHSANRIPICLYDIQGTLLAEYISIRKAAKQSKTTREAIIRSLRQNKVCKGMYLWKYKEVD